MYIYTYMCIHVHVCIVSADEVQESKREPQHSLCRNEAGGPFKRAGAYNEAIKLGHADAGSRAPAVIVQAVIVQGVDLRPHLRLCLHLAPYVLCCACSWMRCSKRFVGFKEGAAEPT
mmetsp:Transcript_32766/g.52735  ORF Transcript_32766/g.52735 Transcript_32766/m.52735 type:complete len:117 (-) Transcript_32766:54-404(-)